MVSDPLGKISLAWALADDKFAYVSIFPLGDKNNLFAPQTAC